jgi:hypothetical protein
VSDPRQDGLDFEVDLAVALGVDRVPGSGNQWYSKLDLKGKGFRISAKSSRKHVIVDNDLIDEAIVGCDDGTTPLWAIRIPAGDFIMLDLDDFKSLMAGEIEFEIPVTKREERKARASVPQLFRE